MTTNDDHGGPVLPECNPTPEARRWNQRFLLLSLGIGVVVIAAAWFGRQFPLRSPMRIGMGLVQGAATAVIIVGAARSIRRLDEMQQRIHLDALAFAFAGTGVLATAYGFLVNAGLPDIDWGGIVWPAMVALWVIGLLIANRRYR